MAMTSLKRSNLSVLSAAIFMYIGTNEKRSKNRSAVERGSNNFIGRLNPTIPFPLTRHLAT